MGTKTTDNLNVGTTNKYYLTSLFNTDLATKTTDDLNVGTTNKYYLTSLFNADLATKTTTNITEGTNLYYTSIRFGLDFAARNTDYLGVGPTNKYYLTSLFNADLATKTTDNLTQGTTNKYLNAFSILDTTEINHTYTTLSPILSSVINAGSITPAKLTSGGANMVLISTPSSINTWASFTGDIDMTLTGFITITPGAIQLEKMDTTAYKTNAIANTLALRDSSGGGAFTNILTTTGTSNIIDVTAATASLQAGAYSNGVIRLSTNLLTGGYQSVIQQNSGNLYIDNGISATSINIGTITPTQTINIGSTTSTVNIKGGVMVNAIGGTTVASTVKFKKYGRINNFVANAGSPTVPSNTAATVAVTGFTAADVPYIYVFTSLYNSGTYNCNVIGNINSTGTSMSIYVNNINTTASTCQIFWTLKYIV